MILLHRRRPTRRVEKIRGELVEGFGHLKSAGSCAAEGVALKAAPHVDNALTVVGLRKPRRRRWPWVAGAIAVGTAAGVAGVVLWRRQNESAETQLYVDDAASAGELRYDTASNDPRADELAGLTIN